MIVEESFHSCIFVLWPTLKTSLNLCQPLSWTTRNGLSSIDDKYSRVEESKTMQRWQGRDDTSLKHVPLLKNGEMRWGEMVPWGIKSNWRLFAKEQNLKGNSQSINFPQNITLLPPSRSTTKSTRTPRSKIIRSQLRSEPRTNPRERWRYTDTVRSAVALLSSYFLGRALYNRAAALQWERKNLIS